VNPRCQPLPAGAPRHGIHVALVSPQRAPNLGARLRVIKSDGVVFASINPTIPCGQYASIPEQFGLMMGVSSDNFEEGSGSFVYTINYGRIMPPPPPPSTSLDFTVT